MADRKNDPASAPHLAAVPLDMDGVTTNVAQVHMAAWKRVSDAHLKSSAQDTEPFSEAEYRAHVDGKPDPAIMSRACEQLGIPPARTAFVGDATCLTTACAGDRS